MNAGPFWPNTPKSLTLVAADRGAYFAASGLQASGFMAVFVFGIVLGNKEAFGFRMEAGEAQKLAEFVLTTAFIMCCSFSCCSAHRWISSRSANTGSAA